MSLEHVGAVATAGLVAGAIERPTGEAGEKQRLCTDCGTELTGRFCHNCGQPAHLHRTLLHLGEELLHGVLHFDGRVWRTLPMLVFRPGTLTRNWVHGKRSRYVSPLAMFLFTVFVMFMVLSYLPAKPQQTLAQAQASTARRLAREQAKLTTAEQALAAAAALPAKSEERSEAQARVKELQADVKDLNEDLEGMKTAAAMTGADGDWKAQLRNSKFNINTGDKSLDKKLTHLRENPELATYKLTQSFYKFSFLLVPLSIPFVALLFLWKRGTTLYDHGVFILYSITFVSLMFMLVGLLGRLGSPFGGLGAMALMLGVPTHMFFQLKGAYGLRAFSAVWRTFMLLIFCNIALTLFALSVVALTFA